MAVSRVSLSSITQGFPKSRSFLDGNSAYIPSSFESIATVTGASGTITFSSIPSTYKHLQVRILAARSTGSGSFNLTINGDLATNYSWHRLIGDGAAATAAGGATSGSIQAVGLYTSTTSTYGVSIIDILDYASTSKNKTVRVLTGVDDNTTGSIYLTSGAWYNTTAINSLTFTGSYTTASTFALYGIKG